MEHLDVLRFLRLLGKDYFFPGVPYHQKLILREKLGILDEDNCCEDAKASIYDASRVGHKLDSVQAEYTSADIKAPGSLSFDPILSLCGSDGTSYLVRNDNCGGGRIEVESLRGKSVMICCVLVPVFWTGTQRLEAQALSSACFDLYKLRDDVEVVIVAKMRPGFGKAAFDHFMSAFPSSCLVVPFLDSRSRDYICKSLNFTCRSNGLLVAPDHKVLWHKSLSFLKTYGADAFPFTDQSIQALRSSERNLDLRGMSLDRMLCCDHSDVLGVISGDGGLESASISQLESKIVGVYLCRSGAFLPKLKHAYDYCKAQHKEFELVVVYLPFQPRNDDPLLFQEHINLALEKRKMSCRVLPFKSWVSLKLSRLIRSGDDSLLIVGPHGKFVDPYGDYVIQKYGVDTYPFTREVIIQREVERIRTLTLESLLVYGDRKHVFRDNGDQLLVPELQRKNILLYLDYEVGYSQDVYVPLIKYYSEIKAKDSGFEVVFLRLNISKVPKMSFYRPPWLLVCPFDPGHSDFVSCVALRGIESSLIAFGKGGSISSMFAHQLLSLRGAGAYPFDDDLRKEVISHLCQIDRHMPLSNLL